MATINKRNPIIEICTTPNELRKLADNMESVWRNLSLGDSCEMETWIGENATIVFSIDQEKMFDSPKD